MKFAILRVSKLKSKISMKNSLKHSHREQETSNADPKKREQNTVLLGPTNVSDSFKLFKSCLPKKPRKNGVLCIEYLVTASSEILNKMDIDTQNQYFKDALQWLIDRHELHNVINAGVHRDESTPHMYAYVVPKDPLGKMNCSHFTGTRQLMSQMQSDFHNDVAQKYDLDRGIEGSRAKHISIRQYYSEFNRKMKPIKVTETDLKPKKTGFVKKEKSAEVVERLNNMFAERFTPVVIKSNAVDRCMLDIQEKQRLLLKYQEEAKVMKDRLLLAEHWLKDSQQLQALHQGLGNKECVRLEEYALVLRTTVQQEMFDEKYRDYSSMKTVLLEAYPLARDPERKEKAELVDSDEFDESLLDDLFPHR